MAVFCEKKCGLCNFSENERQKLGGKSKKYGKYENQTLWFYELESVKV